MESRYATDIPSNYLTLYIRITMCNYTQPWYQCKSSRSLSLPPRLELCTVGIKRGILCTRAILQSINDLDSQVHTDTLRIQFKKTDSAGFWITWTKDVDPLRPMLCLRLRFAPLPGRFSDWHVRRNSKRWNVTREIWPCRYKLLGC